jgi:hypothetical protein
VEQYQTLQDSTGGQFFSYLASRMFLASQTLRHQPAMRTTLTRIKTLKLKYIAAELLNKWKGLLTAL